MGDIAHLGPGDIVKFDGVMIKGERLSADESNITGEMTEVRKAVPVNYN